MSTDAGFEDAINVLLATSQMEFPVIDYAGKVMGLLRSNTLIAALSQNPRFKGIIIALQTAGSQLHSGETLQDDWRS